MNRQTLKSGYKCISHKCTRGTLFCHKSWVPNLQYIAKWVPSQNGNGSTELTEAPHKYPVLLCFCTFILLCSCALSWAQGTPGPTRLFSPYVGQRFYEIAYELANAGDSKHLIPRLGTAEDVSRRQAEQAIIFLTATMNLDSRANYVLPDMINLTSQYPDQDRSAFVYRLLRNYLDESADLEVTKKAVRYLLEQLNSREEREKLLEELLRILDGKNTALDSELATLLGLLMAEKADMRAALAFFAQAYGNNKYNKLAFTKLAELVPKQIEPVIYLENLRSVLSENPLDIENALAFAQYAEQLQLYETAAGAYKYCADLFRFLYPSEALPANIYLPWAISNYNTQRNQHRCLQIASELRQSGRFDLLLEAIAGKAAAKIGDAKQANRILQAAEDKALANYQSQIPNRKPKIASKLAWFYCFALPDADKAIDWANKAYSTEPDSEMAAAILAYSLMMKGQMDWAKTLIDNYKHNQIANLAMAQIQLAHEQRSLAIETLKSVIAADPTSLEAERAKEFLAQHGGEYIPPIDPVTILMALRSSFSHALVPTFITPEKIISAQLNVRGGKFSYGSEFSGTVEIKNNSPEPLVISDNGLFTGNIRIDADVSGDLNKKIPKLVSIKIRPPSPVEPGRSILIPVRLVTAELRQTLLTYPQASLDIEFTVYLDPVTTAQGKLTNRLVDVKPATLVVKRPGIKLTGKYLRNRFNSLSKGRQGQKINTAQLFVSLLMEQHAMANREPLYKFMYADWMPDLLKSALLHNLTDDDWVVKVHTMAAMLSLPLDYKLTGAVAKNLDDTHWPVRMIAIFLLAKTQNSSFGKVLDWTAKYDSSRLVRDMAIALGAARPQPKQPAKQPTPNNSKKRPQSNRG